MHLRQNSSQLFETHVMNRSRPPKLPRHLAHVSIRKGGRISMVMDVSGTNDIMMIQDVPKGEMTLLLLVRWARQPRIVVIARILR
jgi:hypothetical protein